VPPGRLRLAARTKVSWPLALSSFAKPSVTSSTPAPLSGKNWCTAKSILTVRRPCSGTCPGGRVTLVSWPPGTTPAGTGKRSGRRGAGTARPPSRRAGGGGRGGPRRGMWSGGDGRGSERERGQRDRGGGDLPRSGGAGRRGGGGRGGGRKGGGGGGRGAGRA